MRLPQKISAGSVINQVGSTNFDKWFDLVNWNFLGYEKNKSDLEKFQKTKLAENLQNIEEICFGK
jgi:hypothetical protein